jgi:hypothetical protein
VPGERGLGRATYGPADAGPGKALNVLTSRDAPTGDRVRCVFRGEDGRPLRPDDIRALAEAPDAGRQKRMAARLREFAAHGRESTSAERVDWSHRITRWPLRRAG